MRRYLSLRLKNADEDGTSKHTGWHTDKQLSQRSEIGHEHERQPGHKEDNGPDR